MSLLAFIAWISASWRIVLACVAAVAIFGALAWWDHRAYQRGYDAYKSEAEHAERERTNAANHADDDARKCALDPDCRMRDDGFRRD